MKIINKIPDLMPAGKTNRDENLVMNIFQLGRIIRRWKG